MKKYQVILMVLVLAVTMLLGACRDNGDNPAPGTQLAGVTWYLVAYSGDSGTHQVLDNTPVTLIFNKETGQLGGVSGCNEYGAPYEVDGNSLVLTDNIIQTLKLCTDEAVMEQEDAFLLALRAAETFEIQGDTLTIMGGVWTIELTTRPHIVSPAEGKLAGTSWKLVSYTGNMGKRDVLENTMVTMVVAEDGAGIGGNAGCNAYGGDCAIDGNSLTISSIFHTEMYCTEEGVMEQEQNFLAALQAAAEYVIDGDKLTITGGGWTLEFEVWDEVAAPAEGELTGTSWVLVSYEGESGKTEALEGVEVTLVFDEKEMNLGGIAGCNHYGASYETGDGTLVLTDDITSTLMACADEAVMEQEAVYLAALQVAEEYTMENDRLTVTGGGWTLIFRNSYS